MSESDDQDTRTLVERLTTSSDVACHPFEDEGDSNREVAYGHTLIFSSSLIYQMYSGIRYIAGTALYCTVH